MNFEQLIKAFEQANEYLQEKELSLQLTSRLQYVTGCLVITLWNMSKVERTGQNMERSF